jgi:hypothetical protein
MEKQDKENCQVRGKIKSASEVLAIAQQKKAIYDDIEKAQAQAELQLERIQEKILKHIEEKPRLEIW